MTAQFITFEGLDGSGKSTQLAVASGWMSDKGLDHVVTHEPGGTPLGEAIREVFLDRDWETVDGAVETLLIFASRRQHLLEIIDPALRADRHVLCDRFTDSTIAYQGFGRGVSLTTLEEVDRLATGRRVPDRTLLFDLPSEMARQRGQSPKRCDEPGGVDRLDAEDLAFYSRVRDGYLELAREHSERFVIIDASGPLDETRQQVFEALQTILGEIS